MKQLRKVLCLVLALVMVLSLGIGAAPRPEDAPETPAEETIAVDDVLDVTEIPAEEAEEEADVPETPEEETEEETDVPETPAEETEEETDVPEAPAEEAEEEDAEEATVEETEEEEEKPAEKPEGNYPMQAFNYRTSDGTEIFVNAPEGAFPEGTRMEVKKVDLDKVQQLLDKDDEDEFEGTVVAAVDISFYCGEEKVQPWEDVRVSYTSPAAATVSNPRIIHIGDTDEMDEIQDVKAEEAAPMRGQMRAMSGAGASAAANSTERVKLSFDANSFSTYAIVWKENEVEKSATIHWGTLQDGEFVDLESPTSIDSSASTVDVNVIIDASQYYFSSAAYKLTEDAETSQVLASTVLRKASDGTWQIQVRNYGEGETYTVETVTLTDGSHIYVYYSPYGSGGYTPPSPPPQDVLPPETEKNVTRNADGTYTIQLDVTGHEDEQITQVGANVIIVMDVTQSMTNAMPRPNQNQTRNQAAIQALTTLINTLDPDTNLINFTAVNFGDTANYSNGVSWTTSKSAMQSYVDGIPATAYGTCWQAGLQGGIDRVNQANQSATLKNNETYVIFVTDGNPNCYTDSRGRWHGSTGPNFDQNSYDAAVANANQLGGMCHLYGVFVGDADGYTHLNNLITGANGVKTINGTDTNTLSTEFAQIAQTIVDNLGAGSVTVDDGVPSLANVGASVSAGSAGGFEYYVTPKGGTMQTWEDAPGATYSQSNGVTWNLSEAGTLKDEWVYTLKFKVWPSQQAYDLIANLNNGLVDFDDLTQEQQDAVDGDKEHGYTMKTNTHLYTTFKDLEGNEYRDVLDASSEAMPLPTTTIKVVKYWNNDLDDRAAIANAQIIVTKDDEIYKTVNLGSFSQVEGYEHKWVQTPDDEIYISMGQMTLDTTTNEINVISSGHDYSVKEPEDYSHNWWLTADVYHPMLINGTPTVLVEVKAAEIPASLSGLADNMHAKDNGKDYYKFGGNLYVAQDAEENILEATNDRRSNLNFTKTVTGNDAPEDAFFTFTAKVTDSEEKDVWFSIYDAPENGAIVKETGLVTGATAEDGNTGYYYMASGSTATIKIKAGWNVRFINLPNDSEYEIVEVESAMEPGWVFTEATSSIVSDYDATRATISGSTASGTIDQANTKYVVTYSNEYKGVFYVYHSYDNTVERFPMAVNGVPYSASNTFNIYALTAENTLYGGYYSDYAGKSSDFDAAGLTYTDGKSRDEGADAKAYSYLYIKDSNRSAWDKTKAATRDGRAMVPVSNAVYYLKEVPTYYLLPYTHYTYNKADKVIRNMWFISAIDDLNYQDGKVGFVVVTDKEAIIVETLTVINNTGGATVTLSPKSLFGNKGGAGNGVQAGYLGYWDASDLIAPNTSVTLIPFWTTMDGIKVIGTMKRTLSFNNGKVGSGGLRFTDTEN